jgi:hypothetical protein
MNHPQNPQDEQLRQALLGYAAEISSRHLAPPASLVYLRAERRSRRLAIDRATRPLRIMQVLCVLCALLACAWGLQQSSLAGPRQAVPTSLLELGCLAIVIVIAGCWTMLRAGQRLSSN